MHAPSLRPFTAPVLVLATLVSSVISSFGAPLIPTVASSFHTSLSTAQWSLTVALLVGTIASPVLGRLGDGHHRRLTLLAGLAIVTLGCAIAALATHILGRALQGVGLALAPLAIAIARESLPTPKVAPTIALLSVSSAAGLGVGYPLSGLLAGAWGLPGAYWFGGALSALTALGVALVIPPHSGKPSPARFDWPGMALLALALLTMLLGISQGAQWGWRSAAIIVLLLGAAIALTAWIFQRLHTQHPLLQLRLLTIRPVLSGDICALVLGVAMYVMLTALTQLVQTPQESGYGLSASPLLAGTLLIPLSLLMFLSSRALPALTAGLGIRAVLTCGCLITALGCGFFALFHSALWQAFVTTGTLGIGLGATFAAIPGVLSRAVPAQETGSAMGFYQVLRFIGFSLGSALSATILTGHMTGSGWPSHTGYRMVFFLATAICVLAAALSWLLTQPREAAA